MEELPIKRLILIVEENLDHARLIERALAEQAQRQIVVMPDGEQAMQFLHRQGAYSDAPRPDLILLDLNLPGKTGIDILGEIKRDANLKRIPIIILTLSRSESDILRSYELQGNCYVVKSTDSEQLFHIVKRIEEFWLGIVTLPLE
ncbi:MAG: response regulator [Synechococcales cyanobacterium C42_A2020_086]|jgi:chemotaxis family two-component system response regulator Rcp1|nr:response regulator [Synechococcales cyanobacterium C42_A2020_086]